ncbi:MAG: peptide ABC transporter substrate-binding protein [Anaerolineales bacterium]|nr:peptide ABC transporter substrate-binding protein [Anaerolineales bacterium]
MKNILFILLITTWLLSACAPETISPEMETPSAATPPGSASNPGGVAAGGEAIIGITEEPASLNPLYTRTTTEAILRSLIVEGLVDIDSTGQYVPVLADALPSISEDGLVLTYVLKPGLRFSNGEMFTCADIQFTLDAILAEYGKTAAGYEKIKSVECENDLTAVVRLNQVVAPYLSLFSYIIPRSAGSIDSRASWEYNRSPIGTGPWMVQSWETGKQIKLVKNPHYRQAGKPYLDNLVILFAPNNTDGVAKLINDKYTIFWELTEADLITLQETPAEVSFAGTPYGSGENELIVFNLADPAVDAPTDPAANPHPILADLRVRQAIELAIDKQQIAQVQLAGNVKHGTTSLPSGPYACPLPSSEFSITKANALLDQAGWIPSEDGIRTKDSLRLSLKIASTSGDAQRLNVERALVEMFQKVGIELLITNITSDELFANWESNGIRKHGQFDLLLYTSGADIDPASYLFNNYHSSSIPYAENGGAGSNYARYVNAKVDRWLDQASSSIDIALRQRLYCQVAEQVSQDIPRLFLFERQRLTGYRTRLQNFQVSPGAANFTYGSQDWWLSP